jgi:hypothetical protein
MNEKLWFKSYDEGVPHTLKPFADKTIAQHSRNPMSDSQNG